MQKRPSNAPKTKPGASPDSRSRVLRSTLLIGVLLIALVAAVAYASTAVYSWAREAAHALPAMREVTPPSVVLSAPSGDQTQAAGSLALQPITPDTESSQPAAPEQPVEDRDRITVLLLGVDQRPDDPSPPRTDNMVVVTVCLLYTSDAADE